MSSRKILKGASLLSFSEVVSQACSLIRNVVLARYLTKADFGVAAMLGMILTIFEMSGKMAFGQQLVQSKQAEDDAYLQSIHFTQLCLNGISALLIILCAWPLAHSFSKSDYFLSIALLSVIPLLNGFTNLDIFGQTRQLKFGPQALSEILPNVITTAAVWPLAHYFHDYRAVVTILIGKALLYCLVTQYFSVRPFRPRYNSLWTRQSLLFGWPLLLSGFIQFGNFQGDSAVIMAAYSLSELGEFSVALTIAMAPGLLIMRVSNSISLPILAEVQDQAEAFALRYKCYAELMALLAGAMMLAMLFCGEHLVVLLFGSKYAGVGLLASWLTAAQAVRVMRNAVGGAAMAKGDTINNLVSSTWRLSGLALAIAVGLLKGSLVWFAVTGLAGEFLALSMVVKRLHSQHAVLPVHTLKPTFISMSLLGLAALAKWSFSLPADSWINWLLLVATLGIYLAVFMAFFSDLRALVIEYFHKINRRLGSPFSAPA